jgi:hypothetical protein
VAKENNVLKLRKDIESIKLDSYFLYGSKYQFSRGTIKTIMLVSEGEHKMYIYIKPMTSRGNQYMKSKTQVVFVTQETITEIKLHLNEEKINSFISSKNNVEDLFK